MNAFLRRNAAPLIAFAAAFVVYAALAGPRLLRQSRDPHFVIQAAAWLDGRLEISRWPTGADDPAKVELVTLKDGTPVRGRRIGSKGTFRIEGGREVPLSELKPGGQRFVHYMSFPPVPSALLLPQVLLRGAKANDVMFTVLCAALVPAAFLILLRRLREAGISKRTQWDDVWLTALLCFGTVFFFCAVQGRVWFTAHVVGVLFAVLYVWASVQARHPLLAGLFLGLATGTRVPMLFMVFLFLLEAWRMAGAAGGERRAQLLVFVRRCALFALPLAAIGLALAWHNYARFHEPTEFGHSYLAVRQQAQIEQYGLFSAHYLLRNLVIGFALVPGVVAQPPYLSISGHGLAMWVTTPALALLPFWARDRHPLRLALWISVILTAAWSLAYQNSGWIQFGYRFSLDYMVLLVLLLALAQRPMTWLMRGLIIASIVVNLFGAATFDRDNRYYRMGNWDYDHPGPPFWVRH
jgi:hypothetical protein